MTFLTYFNCLTYLTHLILSDLVNLLYLTGRAANFLMENRMESASLENERLRTKLKEIQDALEALVRDHAGSETQSHATLIEGIDALTDNLDPVTD